MAKYEGKDQWIVWCGTNAEQDAMTEALGDTCVSVYGSMTPEQKVDGMDQWLRGDFQTMVTKTSIFGMGVNLQQAHRMIFVGLGDSYEQYYQAIRRCYRYGQTRIVDAHVVLSDLEGQIATNITRKERSASTITAGLVAEMRRARNGDLDKDMS